MEECGGGGGGGGGGGMGRSHRVKADQGSRARSMAPLTRSSTSAERAPTWSRRPTRTAASLPLEKTSNQIEKEVEVECSCKKIARHGAICVELESLTKTTGETGA